MAEVKTKKTEASVDEFLGRSDEETRKDCYTLMALMEKITGEKPKMWGTAIIGFGQYHYKYDSGREGDICKVGFSPRKGNLSLYVLAGAEGQNELLSQLGRHKAGKGCLWVKKMSDINTEVLEKMIRNAMSHLEAKFNGR